MQGEQLYRQNNGKTANHSKMFGIHNDVNSNPTNLQASGRKTVGVHYENKQIILSQML